MNVDLEGRRALVGGGSRGIGRACAHELAVLGAEVIVLSRTREDLEAVSNTLPTPGAQRHSYLVADFDKPEAACGDVQELISRTGPLHILVNNSGGPPGGPITDAGIDEFAQALRSHLFTNHLLTQAVLPGMRASAYGRIINIVSVSVRQPLPGLGVSNTTRGAVASWAKTLSGEVAAHGITVNNILPGATGTDRLYSLIETRAKKAGTAVEEEQAEWLSAIPTGRFADPSEIACAVAFLASPAASYITGVSLPVDGGFIDAL